MVPSSKICLIGMYCNCETVCNNGNTCVPSLSVSIYRFLSLICSQLSDLHSLHTHIDKHTYGTLTTLVENVAFSFMYVNENEEQCLPQIPINCVGPFDVHHHNGTVVNVYSVVVVVLHACWCKASRLFYYISLTNSIPSIPFWLLDWILSMWHMFTSSRAHFTQMKSAGTATTTAAAVARSYKSSPQFGLGSSSNKQEEEKIHEKRNSNMGIYLFQLLLHEISDLNVQFMHRSRQ